MRGLAARLPRAPAPRSPHASRSEGPKGARGAEQSPTMIMLHYSPFSFPIPANMNSVHVNRASRSSEPLSFKNHRALNGRRMELSLTIPTRRSVAVSKPVAVNRRQGEAAPRVWSSRRPTSQFLSPRICPGVIRCLRSPTPLPASVSGTRAQHATGRRKCRRVSMQALAVVGGSASIRDHATALQLRRVRGCLLRE